MDYRGAAPAVGAGKVRKPFAVQAAQYAFWAPIVMVILGLGINSAQRSDATSTAARDMSTYVNLGLAGLNLLVAVSALAMGIVALSGMKKHGKTGILWQAVLGIGFSVAILSLYVIVPLFLNPSTTISKRLAGNWLGRQKFGPAMVNVRLTLNLDGQAGVQLEGPTGTLRGAGQWRARWQSGGDKAMLMIKFDGKQDAGLGDGVVWTVASIRQDELVLESKKPDGNVAEEHYQRQK